MKQVARESGNRIKKVGSRTKLYVSGRTKLYVSSRTKLYVISRTKLYVRLGETGGTGKWKPDQEGM